MVVHAFFSGSCIRSCITFLYPLTGVCSTRPALLMFADSFFFASSLLLLTVFLCNFDLNHVTHTIYTCYSYHFVSSRYTHCPMFVPSIIRWRRLGVALLLPFSIVWTAFTLLWDGFTKSFPQEPECYLLMKKKISKHLEQSAQNGD